MPIDTKLRPVPAGAGAIQTDAALDDALRNTFPASDPVAMQQPAPHSPEPPVVERTVEARQGVTGHNVRYVLGYGLAGIVVAFAIVYFIFSH